MGEKYMPMKWNFDDTNLFSKLPLCKWAPGWQPRYENDLFSDNNGTLSDTIGTEMTRSGQTFLLVGPRAFFSETVVGEGGKKN